MTETRSLTVQCSGSVLYAPSACLFKALSVSYVGTPMLSPIRSVLLFGLLIVSIATISRVAADEPAIALKGQVIDAGTQQPVAARIRFQSVDGRWFFPKSASGDGSAIEYKRQAGEIKEVRRDQSGHDSLNRVRTSTCPGESSTSVEKRTEDRARVEAFSRRPSVSSVAPACVSPR